MVEKEKITIKKPVVKKTTTPTKASSTGKATKTASKAASKTTKKEEKNVEIKEISDNQVKVIKKTNTKKTLDNLDRSYATGKRKRAVARVWIKKGNGKIIINNKSADEYLKRTILEVIINSPFAVTDTGDKFNVICTVTGGGLSGQAGAIRHGIAKALELYNTEAYRKDLKKAGFLTRDSRKVERKKAGLKKARKGQVFSRR